MALADILAAMEAQVDAEIHQIEEQTAATIAQIRAAAENEARLRRERHHRAVLVQIENERAQRLNRARLAALRATSRAREQFFVDALARAQALLAGARNDPCYPAVLRALAEEALGQLDGEARLRADPRDEPLLHALFPQVQIAADLETWGGVEARTLDGRIVVVDTLEARLDQAQDMLRQALMPLVEAEADPWATMTMLTHDFVP
jgi:vacuolar-type H+-ATPase subunit E/Vma4